MPYKESDRSYQQEYLQNVTGGQVCETHMNLGQEFSKYIGNWNF